MELNTQYGVIKGVTSPIYYDNGQLKECILTEKNTLETSYGQLIPQYEYDEVRKKYINSLSFYENGNLKVISLNESTDIKVKTRYFSAEKITFYEDGHIKRLFHLNGKLTAYWTEENEYELAKEYDFNFKFGSFKSKFISLQFYGNEKIKSITLWPKENVLIKVNDEDINIRIGISLYENGCLKSCEPNKITSINTPIGSINAYDYNALGIHGENNSLAFYENGNIKSISTSTDSIEVYDISDRKITYIPLEKDNLFNKDIKDLLPLVIIFNKDAININGDEYRLNNYRFIVNNNYRRVKIKNYDCSSCELSNVGIQIKK
jgi:MORN repeat variant.